MITKTHQSSHQAGYILAALLISIAPRHGAADFVPLGDLPGGPFASGADSVSADGTTVVGASSSRPFSSIEPFVWTQATGMVGLGSEGRAFDVSGDGSVVVGLSEVLAFRWTQATGMVSLGINGSPRAMSDDGTVVVGELLDNEGSFVWSEATGVVPIGGRRALGVSADGSVVVGVDNSTVAFRWTQATGMVSLGALPGGSESFAESVSPDGTVIVGTSDSVTPRFNEQAFRWTQKTGMVGLGDLPGGLFFSSARAVSANGAVIVGDSVSDRGGRTDIDAFVWDQANGMRHVQDVLSAQGDDLTGWELVSATGVSADGRTIVGWGFNPDGQTEGWLARIGAPGSQRVTIDIKPGSFPNSINPLSNGRIPVAILTTDTFDATTVDPTTIRFGRNGREAAPLQSVLEDVDGDGDADSLLDFLIQQTGIRCGDISALLKGETFGGQRIEGADSIQTIGCVCPATTVLSPTPPSETTPRSEPAPRSDTTPRSETALRTRFTSSGRVPRER